MLGNAFLLKGVICCISISFLTGCSPQSSIVSIDDITKLVNGHQSDSNYEMVKLRNGVVIYKDNSASSTEEYNNSQTLSKSDFGPADVTFDPDPVAFYKD